MALKLYTGRASALKVYASDWKAFAKELYKTDKTVSFQLKKDFKEIMRGPQRDVRAGLKELGRSGPMAGGMRRNGMAHGGRTGWGRDFGSVGSPVGGAKRYPHDSVLVEAFNKPKRGQTGIARLRVRSAATVIADLAKKSNGNRMTRMYKIREFGGEEIMRTHEVRPAAVQKLLNKFGPVSKPSKRKKSRFVYPAFDGSYSSAAREAEKAIDRAVRIVEANIDRKTR
jgi:hypothetical protein